MGLRLDVDNLGRSRRRRRRRRRRRSGEHRRHHGLRKRLGIDQRNGNHHFFKHGSYLLPAGARRPGTFSLPRVLLPAAGPVPAATPWPRQRFQATTSGAAIPKLEYVPTTIPTTRAKEKARSTWPPIRNRTS